MFATTGKKSDDVIKRFIESLVAIITWGLLVKLKTVIPENSPIAKLLDSLRISILKLFSNFRWTKPSPKYLIGIYVRLRDVYFHGLLFEMNEDSAVSSVLIPKN